MGVGFDGMRYERRWSSLIVRVATVAELVDVKINFKGCDFARLGKIAPLEQLKSQLGQLYKCLDMHLDLALSGGAIPLACGKRCLDLLQPESLMQTRWTLERWRALRPDTG